MASQKQKVKIPAVKRIQQELKEMQGNSSDYFISLPLEDDMFEWQFAIRGPSDTEFEGGIYHGRIQLPAEYPFKPPSFMLLTPNGRFETQTKICLSISNYHPEHWQPSWSVRTALVALIAFMPTEPGRALGALDYPKEVRRALALKSREAPPKFGNPERQTLINEIHQYMLSKVPPPIPQLPQTLVEHSIHGEGEGLQLNHQNGGAAAEGEFVEVVREFHWHGDLGPYRFGISVQLRTTRPVRNEPDAPRLPFVGDRILTYAAVGLIIAIGLLLLKKLLIANGYGAGGMGSL
ncbi:hypothetical protein Vadar_004188 [Vaccinium darrowii]|uniref:Uncharacterized protein n=1 Tax=Vaccinium darrowii TaxID=229202 RepID=A0ACB7X7V9_9ERIC|nr:hypothetical protein Vadar_004188 [Vaccinium darrowii]